MSDRSPARFVVGGYGSALGAVTLTDDGFGSPDDVALAERPSCVIVSPDGRFAYAVLENAVGAVAAWAVSPTGSWQPLGEQPTGGADPAHLALSPDGRWLVAANYTSGSVCVHPVRGDGSLGARTDLVQHEGPLGPVSDRQDGPHAHQVVFVAQDVILVCELGLDLVITYRIDLAGGLLTELSRAALTPGTGPRHLVLSADGHEAYVVGELSSTVTTCRFDGIGLQPGVSASTRLPGETRQNTPAGIVLSASGDSVMVSNRGDDTLAEVEVEGTDLRLDEVVSCGGQQPRWLALGPEKDQLLVANQGSDRVTVLRRGPGGWAATGGFAWPAPTCLALLPSA